MHEELCRVRDRLLLDQALTDLDDVACLLPFQPVGLVKIRLKLLSFPRSPEMHTIEA